jgi:hypothetical protein
MNTFAIDDVTRGLRERQAALPADTEAAENRLAALRVDREKALKRVTELRVKVGVGLAKPRDVERAAADLAAVDRDLASAEAAFDELATTATVLAQALAEQKKQRRAEIAPRAADAARKFAAAVEPHLAAIEALMKEAAPLAAEIDREFATYLYHGQSYFGRELNVHGPVLGVLEFFEREGWPNGIARFRQLVAELK